MSCFPTAPDTDGCERRERRTSECERAQGKLASTAPKSGHTIFTSISFPIPLYNQDYCHLCTWTPCPPPPPNSAAAAGFPLAQYKERERKVASKGAYFSSMGHLSITLVLQAVFFFFKEGNKLYASIELHFHSPFALEYAETLIHSFSLFFFSSTRVL